MRSKLVVLVSLLLLVSVSLLAEASVEDFLRIYNNQTRRHNVSKQFFSRNRDINVSRELSPDSLFFQFWDVDKDDWTYEYKKLFEYDNQGKISKIFFIQWNFGSGDWYNSFIIENSFSYNSNGNLTEILAHAFIYYPGGQSEMDVEKYTMEYNERGQITNAYYYDFPGAEDAALREEFRFTYDERHYCIEAQKIEYLWTYREVPVGYDRVHLSYDEKGRINEMVSEYSQNGENYYKDYRETYEYHSSDTWTYDDFQRKLINVAAYQNVVLEITETPNYHFATEYSWNDWDEKWLFKHRDRYVYNGNQIEAIYTEYWEELDKEWVEDGRMLISYDSNGMVAEFIEQFVEDDEWQNFTKIIYCFSGATSVEKDESIPSMTRTYNYPNPFNPETTISFNLPQDQHVEVAVYNSKGQLVNTLINENRSSGLNSVVWNGTDSNNKSMPSGLYLYRITGENISMKGKMLMLK